MAAPHAPTAPFSSLAGNVRRSRARAVGCSIAPNTPWSARNATTRVTLPAMLPDRPMAAELAANPATPVRKIFLWPNRSRAFQAGIRLTARASR